jgi:hypothetical protein
MAGAAFRLSGRLRIHHACRLHNTGSKRDYQPMSPPTEQLIRDYLNRLSVAARGQLGPDDRRALVNRTRDFIERKTVIAGPPTGVEVARLLAGLGDPSRLVQQERQRLAAVRGEAPEPATSRSRFARVLRREPANGRSASWHWPVQEGSRADLLTTLLDASEQGSDSGSNGTARNGVAHEDNHAGAGGTPVVPAQSNEPGWFLLSLGGRRADAPAEPAEPLDDPAEAPEAPEEPLPGPARPRWPSLVATADGMDQSADLGLTAVGEPEPALATPVWQLTTPRDPVISRQVRRALTAIAAWYHRRPLEASAVVLLGLGGAIYPPVWLVGAVVALTSRLWDYRDKWLGLALPVLLTLIGTAIGVTNGGQVSVGQGVHEGWVYAVVVSRIAAALGACYLGWRSVHGRRPPAVPPWNRPHKIG